MGTNDSRFMACHPHTLKALKMQIQLVDTYFTWMLDWWTDFAHKLFATFHNLQTWIYKLLHTHNYHHQTYTCSPTAWPHYRNSNPFIVYSCDISFQPPFQPSLRTQVLIMFPWICSSNNIISPNLHKCVTNLVV